MTVVDFVEDSAKSEARRDSLMQCLWKCLNTLYDLSLSSGSPIFSATEDIQGASQVPYIDGYHVQYDLSQHVSFFITQGGLLGVGPRVIAAQDQVVVLFGSDVPHVLRKIPDTDTFALIDEAFVHGLMEGEAIEQWENGELDDEWITLC